MTYRTRSIKRERRTKGRVLQLGQQIVDVLRDDRPQSVRHVFYRMTDPRLPEPVEKSKRGYRHVQYAMTWLRRNGFLPYGWITDATRRGYYTKAGVLIDVAIERELREHLSANVDLRFHRLGITEAQIEQFDLPRKPRKASDRRSRHVTGTVEAEAMPARVLRGMLRQSIETLVPAGALAVAKIAEASEREHIERMASILEGAT